MCSKCGLTQFFADEEARAKPATATGWQKLIPQLAKKGFIKPPSDTSQQRGINPQENEWQAFVSQAIDALRDAGIQVGNEIRGENVLLEKSGVWLDLGVYFEHRSDSDSISRIVERARMLCQE